VDYENFTGVAHVGYIIEGLYNRKILHSAVNYMTPEET